MTQLETDWQSTISRVAGGGGQGRPHFRTFDPSSHLVAVGWLEQLRWSKLSRVWKIVLLSLVKGRREGEEATLWVQREIINETGKTQLESLQQFPVKMIEYVEFVDDAMAAGENRFAVRVRGLNEEAAFRCPSDEGAIRNWVRTIEAVCDYVKNGPRVAPAAPKPKEQDLMSFDDVVTPSVPAPLRAHRHPSPALRHPSPAPRQPQQLRTGHHLPHLKSPPRRQAPPRQHSWGQNGAANHGLRPTPPRQRLMSAPSSLPAGFGRHNHPTSPLAPVHHQQQSLNNVPSRVNPPYQYPPPQIPPMAWKSPPSPNHATHQSTVFSSVQKTGVGSQGPQAQHHFAASTPAPNNIYPPASASNQRPQPQQQFHANVPPQQAARAQPTTSNHHPQPQQQRQKQHFHTTSAASAQASKLNHWNSTAYGQSPTKQQVSIGVNTTAASSAQTSIKQRVVVEWALQPPAFQQFRPIRELLPKVQVNFALVAPHPYFAKWSPVQINGVVDMEKHIRKLRFFLHPDKLPKGFSSDQTFLCRLLWDIINDAWEEHKSRK